MAPRAEVLRDVARCVDLAAVALVVVDRQRIDREPALARDGRHDHGIEPAGQQDNRFGARISHPDALGSRSPPGKCRRLTQQLPPCRASPLIEKGAPSMMPWLWICTRPLLSRRIEVRP